MCLHEFDGFKTIDVPFIASLAFPNRLQGRSALLMCVLHSVQRFCLMLASSLAEVRLDTVGCSRRVYEGRKTIRVGSRCKLNHATKALRWVSDCSRGRVKTCLEFEAPR